MRGLSAEDVYDIFERIRSFLCATSTGKLGWAGAVSVLVRMWSARAALAR